MMATHHFINRNHPLLIVIFPEELQQEDLKQFGDFGQRTISKSMKFEGATFVQFEGTAAVLLGVTLVPDGDLMGLLLQY